MDHPSLAIDLEGIRSGDKAAVARALNQLEDRRPRESERAAGLVEALSRCGRPRRHVIGITGPPGAGKSTLIARLVHAYRSAGYAVGVLAVDPSSRRSGGALLGDRARIEHDPTDAGVFIRSMAAGRHLGGLAGRSRNCLVVLEAAYDRVLIETTGVGQSETEIEQVADTVVYVVQPGSGDSLQFMKAGIMEIPDLLVVNKADLKNPALKALHELQGVTALSAARPDGWTPVPMLVSALEGWGQEALVAALDDHYRFLSRGELESRRRRQRVEWAYLLFSERFGSYGVERLGGEAVIRGRLEEMDLSDPFRALQELARGLSGI